VKTILTFLIGAFLKFALWFRYRVTVKGLDKLNKKNLAKPGGVLILPNHPTVFVDPTLITMAIWKKFPIRPMIVEYMYYKPFLNKIMRLLDGLPIPNFATSSNSLKRKKSEKVIQEMVEGLGKGENFLIYPAGKLKSSALEVIGGSSAVHRILNDAPEANVVLVRIKGLWGSSFSKAFLGKTPPMVPVIIEGIKSVLKNLLFFTPRREVIIEFEPAPADFPYKASRLELNRYLERWYNRPDGLSPQEGDQPGDSLLLVPHSMWSSDISSLKPLAISSVNGDIDTNNIPDDVKNKVIHKVAEMSDCDPTTIKPSMALSTDLGMDSLDIAELVVFLQDQFDLKGVPVSELTTVGKLMALASKQVTWKEEEDEEVANLKKWNRPIKKEPITYPPGNTIIEAFLNNSQRMGKAIACADMRSGILTYSELKLRAILLAEHIRKLPGEYIGILLPASVAAYATILAVQLAGKIPVLINWTVGPRHLETVVKLSNLKIVLTSWSFLDRLESVDLNGIEDYLVMLEDVRREFSLVDKIKALLRSKRSPQAILKTFGVEKMSKDHPAVILFTSGTESMPKGVPLSHHNILCNQRAAMKNIVVFTDDVFLGILPPFHSFGFNVSGFLCLLVGVRIAYSPDPTDGKRLAQACENWGITILCGAPSFLKGLLKVATPEQIQHLRFCVTGAEKAPPELFQLLAKMGKDGCLLEGYGITECAPVLTMNRLGEPPRGVGEPLPNVELLIVHLDTYEPLPQGKQGLILARGENIFKGYLNPGLSSPFVTVNGKEWYKTGDLGYLDEEGFLIISGRMKRFVKVGPEMVSLPSIEDALLQAAEKRGWKTDHEGPCLAICAKEQPGEKPKIFLFACFSTTVDEVNKTLKESGFSNLVKVSIIKELSEIPLMGSGKINYRVLEERYVNI